MSTSGIATGRKATPTTDPVGSGTVAECHQRPRMEDHVVFVTGGTRGIGAAISRSFASQGAMVAAGYSRDREHAACF